MGQGEIPGSHHWSSLGRTGSQECFFVSQLSGSIHWSQGGMGDTIFMKYFQPGQGWRTVL